MISLPQANADIDRVEPSAGMSHLSTAGFSIVMPAYNAAKTIEESVHSVLQQTEQNWELLIANDCSKDQTAALVEAMAQKDPRIKLINLATNSGVAGARNASLMASKGRYICFLDSDDRWAADMLEQHRHHFAAGAKVSFTSYQRFSDAGAMGVVLAPQRVHPWVMYFINPIGNLTGAYDRASLGVEKQAKVRHEDYLMWFNLVKRAGGAMGSKRVLAYYRVAASSLSGNKLKAATWHWHLVRKEFKLSLVLAVPAFAVYCLWSVGTRVRERLSRTASVARPR
jgi:teichuronic acid biosynthesis glycosyltransferase TuaG